MTMGAADLMAWPRCAQTLGGGRTRVRCEDFQVEELLTPPAVDDGQFIWMQVRKRNLNTRWVAAGLARHFAVRSREVGWAGLKDRRAVTTQWFSIRARHLPLAPWFEPGSAVLRHCRARAGLAPGDHAGNQFALRIRDVTDRAATEAAVRLLAQRRTVPNYFGPQRFGWGGGNLAAVRAWAAGERRPKNEFERGIWLSAGRAWLFNLALAERVTAGDWNEVVAGDWVIGGTAAGPLWGDGRSLLQGEALRRCQTAWCELDWLTGFLGARRISHGTRPWQLAVEQLAWRWQDDGDLLLEFRLPPGGFATVVVRELLLEVAHEAAHDPFSDASSFEGGGDDEMSDAA